MPDSLPRYETVATTPLKSWTLRPPLWGCMAFVLHVTPVFRVVKGGLDNWSSKEELFTQVFSVKYMSRRFPKKDVIPHIILQKEVKWYLMEMIP